jgi:hypothetical protein
VQNGDGLNHTLAINNGGTVTRNSYSELIVGMGVDVNQGGTLNSLRSNGFGFLGSDQGPLHFTAKDAYGQSLWVNGGTVVLNAGLSPDY